MSANAWRRESETPSLSEVFRSIAVGNGGTSRFRRFLAFIGPGYLVAVGYMDPGNWATSLAGGAAFGYTLLFVALLSNIMAILLQSLCARLAVASGRDLAQACRDAFPKWMSVPLWVLAEGAIIATDLAEVIGTAIGLNLLFGIPLEIGIFITAADVFLILWLQNKGFRWIEALIISLMALIAACFVVLIAQANPVWGEVIAGFAPSREIVGNPTMLYLALGIIGATVMPHNLYLHSGIVQTRAFALDLPAKREALRLATWDSTIALMFALTINASILILAAAAFYTVGENDVAEIDKARGAQLHRHSHHGRANRDGGVHQPAHRTLGAAADHPLPCNPARHLRDPALRQRRRGSAFDPEPGRFVVPTALCHCAFGHVHRQPRQDG